MTNYSAKQNPTGTITARELIEVLEGLEPDALVAFASDYGDYCHTMQVHGIEGDVEEHLIEESAYSKSGWALNEEDGSEEEEMTEEELKERDEERANGPVPLYIIS